MPQFNSIVDTTELQAVNEMLAVIGEAPIAQGELDSPTRSDVTMAVNIMKDVLREALSMGWRFNLEIGYEIAPNATDSPFTWTYRDATTDSLNVFEVPTDMIAFEVTPIPAQQGTKYPDLVVRDATQAATTAKIFYDRAEQRDGLVVADFDFLYINYIRYVDWDDAPEVFRRYCTILASRRFQQRTIGSQELDGYTDADLRLALRNLKREQGENDDHNLIYNNAGPFAFLGRRKTRNLGALEDRDSKAHT